MEKFEQKVQFWSIKDHRLESLLQISSPALPEEADSSRQLRYVQQYVQELACETVLVEQHYVDRDHMEDHSVFYSKNLHPYPNFCQRAHFFSSSVSLTQRTFERIRSIRDRSQFRDESYTFASESYIGFAVIKPLPGSPVGRTVLRCHPGKARTGEISRFDCACDYHVHVLGLPLHVRGLAFQQQDVGVSACATTALWSALQQTRALEESTAATPAQITMRASQYALPFGRSMPSGGLSIDQMCQAVHSLGYAPNLFRVEETYEVARALLYSSILSGISPVLILQKFDRSAAHAVAVAGMKLKEASSVSSEDLMEDHAARLLALYIHDDRVGPYLQAKLTKQPKTCITITRRDLPAGDKWALTHVLIPMHAKIRLSFSELQTVSVSFVKRIHVYRESVFLSAACPISWESWIVKSHVYVESLITGATSLSAATLTALTTTVPFSRYLAVVRAWATDLDPIDLLLDTTSTETNLKCLGIIGLGTSQSKTAPMVEILAAHFGCIAIS